MRQEELTEFFDNVLHDQIFTKDLDVDKLAIFESEVVSEPRDSERAADAHFAVFAALSRLPLKGPQVLILGRGDEFGKLDADQIGGGRIGERDGVRLRRRNSDRNRASGEEQEGKQLHAECPRA